MKWITASVALFLCCFAGAAMVISMAQADCGSDLNGTYEGAGSLGGVMGTGVTKAEILKARRHPYGGTAIVPNTYRSTAYSPAAGGINCDSNGSCETTASGIKVDNGKRRAYLIASNPQMNKYGALVYIWPNPYNWTGPFVVADTGGNFDGSDGTYRVDFYVWGDRDETFANAWGNSHKVRLSSAPITQASARLAVATNGPQTSTAVYRQTAGGMTRPTSGPITSPFGQRWGRLHAGVDIAPSQGTPVVAALTGRVIHAAPSGGYGNYVCIRHSQQLTTCYGHLQRFAAAARSGAVVTQGTLIGYVGNTGHSTGPHLHFEMRRGPQTTSQPIDPMPYLEGAQSITVAGEEGQNGEECQGSAENPPEGTGLAGVKAAADYLDRRRLPYCYGGGHGVTPARPTSPGGNCTHSSGSPNGSGPGLDCSSSASFVLQQAGYKLTTMTSGGLMSWGRPGKGKHVTIWANASHVFLEIDGNMWGTSVTNHRSGPGWIPARSTAGFTARHPEGL